MLSRAKGLDSEAGKEDAMPDATAAKANSAGYELPPTNTVRWVARRKAQVVKAVHDGIISLEEACLRYALSVEEFLSWQKAVDTIGIEGLLTTGSTARNRRRSDTVRGKK